jgi:hypothetical protein
MLHHNALQEKLETLNFSTSPHRSGCSDVLMITCGTAPMRGGEKHSNTLTVQLNAEGTQLYINERMNTNNTINNMVAL